jgi:hypothetical protein
MNKIYYVAHQLKLGIKERHIVLFLFSTACLIRLLPELISYPYPIGYDVINYYIPVTTNFSEHWAQVSTQFPLYALLLNITRIATDISPHQTVVMMAILMFGFFALAIFFLARKLMKLNIKYSLYLAFFVIFQTAVLRTTWDLHRDIFALSTMLFTFSLLHNERREGSIFNWKLLAIVMILSAVTAISDRMIGLLFTASLLIYSAIVKSKTTILCALIAIGFVGFAMSSSNNVFYDVVHSNTESTISDLSSGARAPYRSYTPANLLVLFVIVNGLLIPTGIVGIRVLRNNLLKITWVITSVLSFSWLVFPKTETLVADRWIILSGIFLSIFAAYGVIYIMQRVNTHLSEKTSSVIFLSFLGIFITIGIGYTIMPYHTPFILYSIAREKIETFVPVTMQFNSLDTKDNDKILSAISWINNNTNQNAIIIGEKDWRGFMELYLKDNRHFRYSDNLKNLSESLEQSKQSKAAIYMIRYSNYKNVTRPVYSNGLFSIDNVK